MEDTDFIKEFYKTVKVEYIPIEIKVMKTFFRVKKPNLRDCSVYLQMSKWIHNNKDTFDPKKIDNMMAMNFSFIKEFLYLYKTDKLAFHKDMTYEDIKKTSPKMLLAIQQIITEIGKIFDKEILNFEDSLTDKDTDAKKKNEEIDPIVKKK